MLVLKHIEFCRSYFFFLLSKLNVHPGVSPKIKAALKSKVRAMKPEDRQHLIVLDEMGEKKILSYDAKRDVIVGLEDPGNILGRTKAMISQVTHA